MDLSQQAVLAALEEGLFDGAPHCASPADLVRMVPDDVERLDLQTRLEHEFGQHKPVRRLRAVPNEEWA